MIKINKAGRYLIGLLLTLIIYLVGQLFFFINTEKTEGKICKIIESRTSRRYGGRYEFFYVCFSTKDDKEVMANGGSNFKYDYGDIVTLFYKKDNPKNIRLKEFSALWLMHC